MARLNIERQEELEPKRMQSCQEKLESMGYKVTSDGCTKLRFEFRGHWVQFWPYSGWHTGKTIKDGRGFNNLLKQLR